MVEGNNNFGGLSGILLQAQLFTVPALTFWNYSAATAAIYLSLGLATLGIVCSFSCYQLSLLFMRQRPQGSNETISEALLDPGLQRECGQHREGIEGPSIGPISGSPFLVNSCKEALVVLGGAPPCQIEDCCCEDVRWLWWNHSESSEAVVTKPNLFSHWMVSGFAVSPRTKPGWNSYRGSCDSSCDWNRVSLGHLGLVQGLIWASVTVSVSLNVHKAFKAPSAVLRKAPGTI